jgi:hypothetical protein
LSFILFSLSLFSPSVLLASFPLCILGSSCLLSKSMTFAPLYFLITVQHNCQDDRLADKSISQKFCTRS